MALAAFVQRATVLAIALLALFAGMSFARASSAGRTVSVHAATSLSLRAATDSRASHTAVRHLGSRTGRTRRVSSSQELEELGTARRRAQLRAARRQPERSVLRRARSRSARRSAAPGEVAAPVDPPAPRAGVLPASLSPGGLS